MVPSGVKEGSIAMTVASASATPTLAAAGPLSAPAGVAGLLTSLGREIDADRSSDWAWANFQRVLRDLAAALPARAMLEIGGGRFPLFTQDEIAGMGVAYTVNDISQSELDRAPPYVSKARFDIATHDTAEVVAFAERYDLVFSKMVFEHVRDARQAYANIKTILRPGGVALNFHPVLYALPFVVNRLLPEQWTRSLLKAVFRRRNDDDIPKFPAYYDLCAVTPRTAKALAEIGFARAMHIPFYGHGYFAKFPLVREIDGAFNAAARRNGWRLFATYSYTLVQK